MNVKIHSSNILKKDQRAGIPGTNELAVIPDARKGVQKTLVQFNSTADCIV